MRVDCVASSIPARRSDRYPASDPHIPYLLGDDELADCAGRNAVYQLAALTLGAPLAVADA